MVVDFTNVPPALTVALVRLAPVLAIARRALEIASWRTSSWYDAWLALAAWWALCLFADSALRYLLPVVLLAVLWIPARPRRPPSTEQSVHNTLADIAAIHALLPARPPSVPPSRTALRVVAILYAPYLLLTYCVPLRILLALAGTAVLAARAPFTALALRVLRRSAWLRWSFRHAVSLLTARPLPPLVLSHQPPPTSPTPVPALRFLFTVYENQRWWMGLDWTAALLPGERPSWCAPPPNHAPVSPPNAFVLPKPTTVFLAADGPNPARVKRTAIWSWEEPEWKVVTIRDGGPLTRVDRPIPDEHAPDAVPPTTTGSRLLGKMRDSGIIAGAAPTTAERDGPAVADDQDDLEEDHVPTDPDGWVYADNKWEGPSAKGGMGKYTRYRRWTRVAVVSETVELVEDGPVGIEHPDPIPAPDPDPILASSATSTNPTPRPASSPILEPRKILPPTPGGHALGTVIASSPEEESPLRQRLRRALSKSANHNGGVH